MELSEEQLEAVAGGFEWPSFNGNPFSWSYVFGYEIGSSIF